MKKKVLIVEDQSMPAKLLEIMLKDSTKYEVAGIIGNASYADMYVESKEIDLILMDVLTNGNMTGLEASAKIKNKHPEVKIIIVTSMPECSYIEKAKEAGVEGFYYKDYGDENLLSIMDKVMNGEKIYPQETPDVQIGAIRSSQLSARDIEVLRRIIDGKTDREIGQEMNYAVDTIHGIVKELLNKTGFKTRTRLAVAVRESNFIIN